MRSIKPNTHRRAVWRTVLLAVGAIVIGGAATVGLLAATNVVPLAKLEFWRPQAAPIPRDWIAVPVPVRAIPAYSMVTKDYLINPKTGSWEMIWSPPKLVPKDAILDLAKIRGRVIAHEKVPFTCFMESEFLPPGTRPGVAAGTPDGKRALTLEVAKIKGVFGLKEGDKVDLLADVPLDKLSLFGGPDAGRPMLVVQPAGHTENTGKPRTETRVLARDAVIVSPVTTRMKPVVTSSLTQGTTTRNLPVQEVVLAVGEDEVGGVTKALDWDLGILAQPAPAVPSPRMPRRRSRPRRAPSRCRSWSARCPHSRSFPRPISVIPSPSTSATARRRWRRSIAAASCPTCRT